MNINPCFSRSEQSSELTHNALSEAEKRIIDLIRAKPQTKIVIDKNRGRISISIEDYETLTPEQAEEISQSLSCDAYGGIDLEMHDGKITRFIRRRKQYFAH